MKSGMPVVQGPVPGRGTQPAGYEIEYPYRSEVNVPVNAGGVTVEALGDGLGEALGEGDGLAVGGPPTLEELEGLSRLRPTAPTAITTTAAIATLAKVFMFGNLHGTRMSTRRCGVVSMVSRVERSTQSGARAGASVE
jgi:hypothetical protein